MLDDLRGSRLLDGVRGRPAVDRAAVAAMLVALGRLGLERPDVLEVDLNPVIASAGGRRRGRRPGRAGGSPMPDADDPGDDGPVLVGPRRRGASD